ncbi:MAG: MiaB/RimO family radical SAM methylthiotransferase, partial [Dehalococcoidia bacterium]
VAQSERELLQKRQPRIDVVMGTHQLHCIADIASDLFYGSAKVGNSLEFSREWRELVPGMESRSSSYSAYISIMEGCNNFCSYCIVPYTRGREKFRPYAAIEAEVKDLLERGVKEIILLGQNVNSWSDEALEMDFVALLERLSALPIFWLRFVTSYPGYFATRLVDLMTERPNIARLMHFPAQSGSSRLLRMMNRRYDRSQYLRIIDSFFKKIPSMEFSSDFICGFPGESDYDHRLTLSLLEKVRYQSVFSFVYSPRPGTRAAGMTERLTLEEKKARLSELQGLQAEIQLKKHNRLLGSQQTVLVTMPHPKKVGEWIGRTEQFRLVNLVGSFEPGQIVVATINSVGPHSLRSGSYPP